MDRLRRIIEILTEHRGPADGDDVSAEHDEIYLSGPAPDRLTSDALAELENLHARWDEDFGCWRTFT